MTDLILYSSLFIILGFMGFILFRLIKAIRIPNNTILTLKELVNNLEIETLVYEHHVLSSKIHKEYKNKTISFLWREFEESLVIQNDKIENTLDADHFFNENTLASKVFFNENFKSVGNVLVGLGVVFTFIGLVIGLGQLDINSESTESLKNGIEAIINGAYISFYSSIAGIVSSIGFTRYFSYVKTKLREEIFELQKLIDFKYPRTNPEKSLAQMRDSAKETEMHLGALSETLGDKLQEVIRGLGTEISEGIKESLSTAINPYMEDIASKAMNSSENAFERIVEEFLQRFGEAGETQQKLILETNKEIQESLLKFRAEFLTQVDGLKEVVSNLNESYHVLEVELVDKFHNVVTDLSNAVNNQSQTVEGLATQTNSLSNVTESLQNVVRGFEASAEGINTLLNDYQFQIDQNQKVFRETLNSLYSIYQSNDEVNKNLIEASNVMTEPFAQLKDEYKEMRSKLEGNIDALGNKMNEVLNSYFTQVQQQTNERMSEWNAQTSAFSGAMLDVANELNSVVEKVKKKNS
jgi:uncharacterized membrane-anchored protein YhcB (DUF1043 family)